MWCASAYDLWSDVGHWINTRQILNYYHLFFDVHNFCFRFIWMRKLNGNETAYAPSVIDLWMNFWTDLGQIQTVGVRARSDPAPSSALFRGINYHLFFLLLLSLHIIISEGSKRMSNQHSTDIDSQQITIMCIRFVTVVNRDEHFACTLIYFFNNLHHSIDSFLLFGRIVSRVDRCTRQFCNCKQIASACECERCKVICVSFRIAYEAPMKFR